MWKKAVHTNTSDLRKQHTTLPEGYHLVDQLQIPLWEFLGLATFLFPLWLWLFSFIATILTGEHFSFLFSLEARSPSNGMYTIFRIFVVLFILGPLTITLHEWSHGIAYLAFGYRPRYGFRWIYAYTVADGAVLTRGQFIVVALAPLVLLTLFGLVLFFVISTRKYVILFLAANATGATADLWVVWQLLRLPSDIFIVDHKDSVEIYGKVSKQYSAFLGVGLIVRWIGITSLVFFFLFFLISILTPLLLNLFEVAQLTIGPEGALRVLEYSRTETGMNLSLGVLPLFIVSSIIGLVFALKKSPQNKISK